MKIILIKVYRNKLDSVKKASSDLVYILDSDNIKDLTSKIFYTK